MTEDRIQFEIVQWFRNGYCRRDCNPRGLIFSVPNGGTRNKLEAMKLKSTGMMAGVSDLVVIYSGRILFLELKAEKGRLSDVQAEFLHQISVTGFEAATAYSVEEAKKIIIEKLYLPENQ